MFWNNAYCLSLGHIAQCLLTGFLTLFLCVQLAMLCNKLLMMLTRAIVPPILQSSQQARTHTLMKYSVMQSSAGDSFGGTHFYKKGNLSGSQDN